MQISEDVSSGFYNGTSECVRRNPMWFDGTLKATQHSSVSHQTCPGNQMMAEEAFHSKSQGELLTTEEARTSSSFSLGAFAELLLDTLRTSVSNLVLYAPPAAVK